MYQLFADEPRLLPRLPAQAGIGQKFQPDLITPGPAADRVVRRPVRQLERDGVWQGGS